MVTRLGHYHLGCGHRLQSDYSGYKNEVRNKFQEINKKISKKLNDKNNTGSISTASGDVK